MSASDHREALEVQDGGAVFVCIMRPTLLQINVKMHVRVSSQFCLSMDQCVDSFSLTGYRTKADFDCSVTGL